MVEEVKEQTISLLAQIKEVAQTRTFAQQASEAKIAAHLQWENEHRDLLDNAANTAKAVEEAETLLRELTIKAYNETGSKQPALGVSVKLFQILSYDPKEALKWAMSHQVALSLDKKSFENLAKATPIECVIISEEPRAQIAQNLMI